MLRRAIPILALLVAADGLALSADAADLAPRINGSADDAAVYIPPARSYFAGAGGWHGHYDWDWSQDPHHVYATYGWKQPWSYAPRTLPYREYRPRVVMPQAVQPRMYQGTRPAWTAGWYRYCADHYRSFDPDTGYYTTYSGQRRMCE